MCTCITARRQTTGLGIPDTATGTAAVSWGWQLKDQWWPGENTRLLVCIRHPLLC